MWPKVRPDEEQHLVVKGQSEEIRDGHVAQLKFWLCHGLAVWSWSSSYTSLSLFLFLGDQGPFQHSRGSVILRAPAVGVMDKQVGKRKAETEEGKRYPKSYLL